MKFKKLLFVSLLIVVVLLSACSQEQGEEPNAEPDLEEEIVEEISLADKYFIGTSAGFPPFEYTEGGEVVGFDIDLMKAIGEVKGFEVEVRDLSFDGLIGALNSGNIDMIAAGMTITEERKEVVAFSEPYYSANQSLVVQEGSGQNLSVLFGDNNIGVQTGTTGDLWVTEELKDKDILTGEVKHYDTFVLAITDLVNGNIDGVVVDSPVAARYTELRPVEIVAEIITGEEYGIAVRKEDNGLIKVVNTALEELRESGQMDELIDKYF